MNPLSTTLTIVLLLNAIEFSAQFYNPGLFQPQFLRRAYGNEKDAQLGSPCSRSKTVKLLNSRPENSKNGLMTLKHSPPLTSDPCCEYSNTPCCKYSNIPRCKHSNTPCYKYSNTPCCKYSNTPCCYKTSFPNEQCHNNKAYQNYMNSHTTAGYKCNCRKYCQAKLLSRKNYVSRDCCQSSTSPIRTTSLINKNCIKSNKLPADSSKKYIYRQFYNENIKQCNTDYNNACQNDVTSDRTPEYRWNSMKYYQPKVFTGKVCDSRDFHQKYTPPIRITTCIDKNDITGKKFPYDPSKKYFCKQFYNENIKQCNTDEKPIYKSDFMKLSATEKYENKKLTNNPHRPCQIFKLNYDCWKNYRNKKPQTKYYKNKNCKIYSYDDCGDCHNEASYIPSKNSQQHCVDKFQPRIRYNIYQNTNDKLNNQRCTCCCA